MLNVDVKFSSMWIKSGWIFMKRDSCLIIIGGQFMVKNCHNSPKWMFKVPIIELVSNEMN